MSETLISKNTDRPTKFYEPNSKQILTLEDLLNKGVNYSLGDREVTDSSGITYYVIGTRGIHIDTSFYNILFDQEPELTDYSGVQVYTWKLEPLPLEELRTAKYKKLSEIASAFDDNLTNNEMLVKSSLGFTFNADLRSQNNLRGLIELGSESSLFRDADNNFQSLTVEQLKTLLQEAISNGEELYKQKWEYSEQIKNCTSQEELLALDFKFTMKDFSQQTT